MYFCKCVISYKFKKCTYMYIQGRLKGGANRAIARGPKFWGVHELFEKFFFTIYMKNKNFLTIFLIYY